MTPGGGLEELYGTFALLADVQKPFEATHVKHRLRRLGFEMCEPRPRTPFVSDGFFGDIVLTMTHGKSRFGQAVGDAKCVFYSGVVVKTLVDGIVVPVRAGRPELQVGITISDVAEAWTSEDERALEAMRDALGLEWNVRRADRIGRAARCLVAREDALHVIEHAEDDHARLVKMRDAFFTRCWTDLATLPDRDYEWLAERALRG